MDSDLLEGEGGGSGRGHVDGAGELVALGELFALEGFELPAPGASVGSALELRPDASPLDMHVVVIEEFGLPELVVVAVDIDKDKLH
jgi:hypothetical protein